MPTSLQRDSAFVIVLSAVLGVLAALPASAQTVSHAIHEASLESKVMGEERAIRIWTPRSYDGSQRRYPVLYLTDAETQIFHTAATVEFLARQQRMPEMIVVGVSNTDRTRDLTPTRGTSAVVSCLGRHSSRPTFSSCHRPQ